MLESVRLFVAIDLPETAIHEAIDIQTTFKSKKLFKGQWTKPENLHLTLKFLGNVDTVKIDELKSILGTISFSPCDVQFDKVGVFSSKRKTKILWIHVVGDKLHQLQKEIDRVLSPDFTPEHRFMSHLTICRPKAEVNRKELLRELETFEVKKSVVRIQGFKLKQSVLTPEGPIYSTLETYPTTVE